MNQGAIDKSLAALLVTAIVVTSGTQLRISGLPLGPGEALLMVWFALSLMVSRLSRTGAGMPVKVIAAFWLTSFAVLSAGAVVGLISGGMEQQSAFRDSFAYAFTALISFQMSRDICGCERAKWVAAYFPIAVAAIVGLLFVAAITVRRLGSVDLWYAELRFTALSENPNQLALLLVGVPFLAVQVLSDIRSSSRRLLYAASILITGIAGVASLSDALILAWVIGGTLALLVMIMRSVFGRTARGFMILVLGILLPILILSVIIPLIGAIWEAATEAAYAVYTERGQGQVRFTIWKHGTEALLISPIVGLGPGPHSGFLGPNEGIEAHNTFVDWGASSGLIGLIAYCGMIAFVFVRLVRARQYYLAAGVVSIVVFSLFHFVIRQPLFWAYLIICSSYGGWARTGSGGRRQDAGLTAGSG